jgi:hypothetical protein
MFFPPNLFDTKSLAFPLALVKSIMRNNLRIFGCDSEKIMTMYVLIILSLSLAGVAGLQFFYLVYLERMDKFLKQRLHDVERQNKILRRQLRNAETQIAEQTKVIEAAYLEPEDEEIWADIIEER